MPNDATTPDFLTEKEIVRITKEKLDQGRTKQEVVEELLLRHDRKEYLEQIVARVPDAEARARYRVPNKVLALSMNLVCSLNIVLPLYFLMNGKSYSLRVLDPILALVFASLTVSVYRMDNTGIYKAIGLLGLVGAVQSTRFFADQALWGVANVLLFGVISWLGFYLAEHLQPSQPATAPTDDTQDPTTQKT